jgi:replicative DNA helicase
MMDIQLFPKNVKLEAEVLGTIICYDFIGKAEEFLNTECFTELHHQQLWETMVKLHSEKRKPIIGSIHNRANGKAWYEEAGGMTWLMGIAANQIMVNAFEESLKVLYEIYTKRKLMQIASEVYLSASKGDPFEIRDQAEKAIKEMVIVQGGSRTAEEVRGDLIKRFDDIKNNRLVSIPTPFPTWNRLSGGLNNGDLIIIGSYSSNGKTSMGINLVQHAASLGFKCKVYSFEMTDLELYKRQMAFICGLSGKEIEINHRFDDPLVIEAMDRVGSLPVVYDGKHNHINNWVRDVRHEVKRNGVRLVVVDYIQLMHTSKQSRAESIGSIAIAMKTMALELQIPIIGISQMKRAVLTTKNYPPPSIDMLKESGELENSADIICLPWVPASPPCELEVVKFGLNSEEVPTKRDDGSSLMVVKFPKGRNYGTGKFTASFTRVQQIIEDDPLKAQMWYNSLEADEEKNPF